MSPRPVGITGLRGRSPLSGRRKTILSFLALVLVFALHPGALQAFDENGGAASPFRLGAGAKNIAFGGASCSFWQDSYSALWNPAMLYFGERGEVDLFHTSLFDESVTYSSISMSYPFIDMGVISTTAIQLRVGGIERRDEYNRLLPGELKNIQTRYIVGYANRIVRGLYGGISLKLDRYAQGQYLANGFGVDIGFALRTGLSSRVIDDVSFGVTCENFIEPTVTIVSEEIGDPRGVRAGVSFTKKISQRLNDRVAVAFDVEKSRFSDPEIHVGGEYRLKDIFALRCGWGAGITSFGCGFNVRCIDVDYAYRSTELGGNHLFSISYRFGYSRTEKELARQRAREEQLARELENKISEYENNFAGAMLKSAEENLKKGRFQDAAEYYQRVLMWSPDNDEAKQGVRIARASLFVARGDSLYREGRYADALFAYREAEANFRLPEIAERVADCERKIADRTDRKKIVDDIFSRSLDLYAEKKWVEALKGFEKVVELDAGHELAGEYVKKTKEKMAQERGKLLSEVESLVAAKKFDRGVELLRSALDRYPSDSLLVEKSREVSAARDEYSRRIASRKVQRKPPRARSLSEEERVRLRDLYDQGIEYFKHGNFRMAVDKWEPVWRKAPSFEKVTEYLIRAYQYYGMQLYTAHRYEEALRAWQNILRIDPSNDKALRYIERTREELSKLRGIRK